MLRSAPLLLPTIAALLGIALAPYLNWTILVAVLSVTIVWELLKRTPKPLLFVVVALLSALYANLRNDPGGGSMPSPNQSANWILQIDKVDTPKGRYQKTTATPLAAQDSASAWIQTPQTQLELYLDTTLALALNKGNTIAVRGKLRTLEGSYGAWLQAHGISGRIYSYRAAIVDSTTTPPTSSDRAEQYRAQIGRKIASASADTAATALMATLTVSDRARMSADQKAEYRRAGASHLLAISGLHVGIIATLLNLLFGALRLGVKGRIAYGVLVVTLLWGYAWLTGMSPSVVRAVVMFSLLEVGLMTMRSTSSLNLLAAAALAIVLWEPRALFDVGFQLSFVAMLGIVTLYRPIYNLLKVKKRLLQILWGVSVVSVVAQCATAPLVAYSFGQLPLLGVVINFVVWITVPVVIFGTILFLAGLPIGGLVAWVAMLQNEAVTWVSAIEWGVAEGLKVPLWSVWVAYVAMIAMGAWFLRWQRKC